MNFNRLVYIDRIKGVLILWVVWYHTNHPGWANFYYHVPIFMVLSGFFLKVDISFKLYLKRKVNRFFVPFLFFYLFGFLYNLLHYLIQGRASEFLSFELLYAWLLPQALPFNIPIWFIITLFYIFVLSYPLLRWVKRGWIGFGIPMVISYLFNVNLTQCILPFHGNHVIVWFGFVMFGYYYGRTLLAWIEDWRKSLLLGSICFVLYVLQIGYETDYMPIGVFVFYARIFLFFGFMLPLFRYTMTGRWSAFLGYFGRNSLVILGVQSFFLNIFIQVVRPYFGLTPNNCLGIAETVATALLSIPMIYLFNRFCPKLIGKQPLIK